MIFSAHYEDFQKSLLTPGRYSNKLHRGEGAKHVHVSWLLEPESAMFTHTYDIYMYVYVEDFF